MELTIKQLIEESYGTAKEKGWWDNQTIERPFMECLMLIVGEVAEASEEYRVHGTNPEKWIYCNDINPKPEGIAAELADVLIRIGDLCGKYNIPLEEALRVKMAYNKTRPYRHGSKLA